MHPGPAIKRLRKQRDWRLEDLAARVEAVTGKPVNTGNLSRLERQTQGYSDELLQAVAQALGVAVARLFEDDQPSDLARDVAAPPYSSGTVFNKFLDDDEDSILVPRLEVQASAGHGSPRPEQDVVTGHMALSSSWVRRNLPDITSPMNLRLMTFHGNSMLETIGDGDPGLVDVGVREVSTDAIYVFSANDEIYVKTIQRIPGVGLKIISDNRTFDPYTITEETRGTIEILARVRWVWRGRKL